jgi:hypothetical protein
MPYCVYVIRLKPDVWSEKRFVSRNPGRRPEKPCVYVGSTAHTPEERSEQHLRGYKANRYAHRYHDGLHKRLTARHKPLETREEAEKIEIELAELLRRKGYGVWYGV